MRIDDRGERGGALGVRLAHHCKDGIERLEEHALATTWLADDGHFQAAKRPQFERPADLLAKLLDALPVVRQEPLCSGRPHAFTAARALALASAQ